MKVAVGIFSTPVWTLDPRYVEALRARFPGVEFVQAFDHAAFGDAIADADVVFGSMVREESFARARRLKWIHSSAAGVGASMFPALVRSGVIVTNSRGVQSRAIAEHILTVILMWRRRLHVAMRRQASRIWAQEEFGPLAPPPLAGLRVLIVGMGSIGGEARRLLEPIGMRVSGVGRTARDGQAGVDDLPRLLPDADVVVITAPHTPETEHLFNADLLGRMRPGSLLVNVGRGRIIDEGALVEALRRGRPGTAALDVFEREPLTAASPLWDLDEVILTPHVAGFGAGFWEGIVDLFAANLERWQRGEPLQNVVDKTRGY